MSVRPLPDTSSQLTPTRVFQRVRTRDVPLGERFDCWRSQFVALQFELPRGYSDCDAFDGEILMSPGAYGVRFSEARVGPTVCRFGRHESGLVGLGCIRGGGVLHMRYGRDQTASLRAQSGIVLLDCDRPLTTISSRYATDYLALPRALVADLLAGPPVLALEARRILPPGPLARSLQQLLAHLGAHGETLSAAQADRALYEARALAVVLLGRQNLHWRAVRERHKDTLLAAGRCLLRQHTDDSQFSGEWLAATLGCSRAYLYRLFERAGETIAGQLREIRLRRARTLLETKPHLEVGMIALQCGYSDLCAFERAFRRRFGFTPSDWRVAAHEAPAEMPCAAEGIAMV